MKKYAFGIGALMLAIGFSSFSLAPKTTAVWYDFNGTASEHNIQSKYSLDIDNQFDCADNGTKRCEILAEPDAVNPSLPDLNQSYTVRTKQ